jgi:DNA (cytosine-5)-methyltransferase 1
LVPTRVIARTLNVTALFGGIGALEHGLAAAGHSASSFCEIDPEAATILRARFPSAFLVRDIRTTEKVVAALSPKSDLLTAGFPCTDLSQAGQKQGFSGGRSSLVRDALRLVEARPFPHILLENVPNWRTLHRGKYLREVLVVLERLGYKWAYRTIDALAFGLPQRRLRMFLYATLEGDPCDVLFHGDVAPIEDVFELADRAHGFYWTEGTRGLGWGEDCVPTLKGGSTMGVPSPPAIVLPKDVGAVGRTTFGDRRIITPHIRDAERLQGLPVDWTAGGESTLDGDPFRNRRRWVLVGNAVNTRVAAWLGDRLATPSAWVGEPGLQLAEDDRWPAAAWSDGARRYAVDVGPWPVAAPRTPLAEFLNFPGTPLSVRATTGFLGRLLASKLRLRPGFVTVLQQHATLMGRSPQANRRIAA